MYEQMNEAIERKDFPTVKKFVNLGLDFNKPIHYGHSAFSLACLKGFAEAVDLFVLKGADVNRKTAFGSKRSPLLIACEYGHFKVAKSLLRAGADPETVFERISYDITYSTIPIKLLFVMKAPSLDAIEFSKIGSLKFKVKFNK